MSAWTVNIEDVEHDVYLVPSRPPYAIKDEGDLVLACFEWATSPLPFVIKWEKFKRSDLPNDRLSLDDLKRFGIDLANA
jgi:hypothetical protein